jgi:hypothetical protein
MKAQAINESAGVNGELNARPANVGMLALEVYFPHTFVNQTELGMFYLML